MDLDGCVKRFGEAWAQGDLATLIEGDVVIEVGSPGVRAQGRAGSRRMQGRATGIYDPRS
jgi:hypothetical protein